MPGAGDEIIEKLEKNAMALSNVSKLFADGLSNEEILDLAMTGIEYDLFDEIDIDVEPEALTVNGWAMDALARIPTEGDEFEADGLAAKVLKMNGKRIENLHITKLIVEDEEDEDDEKRSKRKSDDDEDDKDSEESKNDEE